jgi:hypothetical protein
VGSVIRYQSKHTFCEARFYQFSDTTVPPSGAKWNQVRNQAKSQTASYGIHICVGSEIWNQAEPRRNQAPKTFQTITICVHSAHGPKWLTKMEPSGTKPGTKLNFRQPRTESPLGLAAPSPFIILNKSWGGKRAGAGPA